MPTLPSELTSLIVGFAPLFSKPVWRHVQVLLVGALPAPCKRTVTSALRVCGLRRLSLMLTVRIPWAERIWALPVLTALCPSERYYEGGSRAHKKLTTWARQMILQLKRWLPEREVIIVADSGFAALELLWAVRREVTMITRLRLDAALYEPAPARRPRQNGRPRLKGARLPTPAAALETEQTVWTQHTVAGWYGGAARAVEVASDTAVWYHTGLPPVPVRWVLVRDPLAEFKPQALLSTDLESEPVEMLAWFVRRRQVEVTFEEARTHLVMETQRQ
jgi:hypothetical protein